MADGDIGKIFLASMWMKQLIPSIEIEPRSIVFATPQYSITTQTGIK